MCTINIKKYLLIFNLILINQLTYGQRDTISLDYLTKTRERTNTYESIDLLKTIIDTEKKIRRLNNLPKFSLKLTGPSFSKSISDILQPDGNYKFREINNISSDIALSVSQNIPLTGAVISLNNNLKRFDYLNEKTHTYSSSWLNINLNQPLNFFNNNKWDKKINNIYDKRNEFEIKKKDQELIDKIVNAYFFLLYNQEVNKFYEKKMEYLNNLSTVKSNLISKNYLNDLDSIDIEISIIENKLAIEDNIKNKQLLLDSYNYLFKQKFLDSQSYFIFPNIDIYIPDLEILKQYFDDYYTNYTEFILVPKQKEIKELYSKRFFSGNISLGYGYNNNNDFLRDVFKSPNSRANLNFNIQIPIIDFNENKLNRDLLDYKYSISKNDLLESKSQLIFNLEKAYNDIYFIKEKLLTLNKLYELKYKQLNKLKYLLEKGYIIFSDYEKKELELHDTNLKRIDLIKNFYLNILEIEKITFVNLL